MALSLGWTPKDARLSYFWRDPAIDMDATPKEARDEYMKDGEASHLVVKPGQSPTRIEFRALDVEERAAVRGICEDVPRRMDGEAQPDYDARFARESGLNWARLWYWCCAVGVSFPDLASAKRELGRSGLVVLPKALMHALAANYGEDFWMFYGRLVWSASQLTEDEKKALSSPPGMKPSASTTVTTVPLAILPSGPAPTSDSDSQGPALLVT